MRVVVLNQIKFPLAFPFLDLLLAADGSFGVFVSLIPNKAINPVAGGESGNSLGSVFPNPF